MSASPTKADARRTAILRVATDVFLTEGYAAASMSAIAARVGGSKATLYNYFKSKEELFAAFMAEECVVEASHAFDFSDYEGDVRAALRTVAERFLRFVTSDRASRVHRLVIAEGARFPELGRAFYEVGPREAIARLEAFLDKATTDGRLRRADPRRAAEQFLALAKSGLHERRLWSVIDHPSDAEITANAEAAVQVFLAAYGPSAAPPPV